MHRHILSAPAHLTVDHINRNRLDNRRCNLRLCTVAENNCNRFVVLSPTSRFKGVTRRDNLWVASIHPSGNRLRLGSFAVEEDAARAYDVAAKKFYGEFACCNF